MADKMTLVKRVCFACSEQFPEVPCAPSDCPIIRVIKSIDPETLRPKGQWVVNRNSFDGYTHHRCSHCGTDAPFVYTYMDEWDEDLDGEWDYIGQRENGIEEQMGSFCPHCGADMRGETDVK